MVTDKQVRRLFAMKKKVKYLISDNYSSLPATVKSSG
jgi:hypothetical protein